jgi:hypothetical protein
MPIFDEIADELSGAAIFSKLDHRAGYHQIRIKEGDEPKLLFKLIPVILNIGSCRLD